MRTVASCGVGALRATLPERAAATCRPFVICISDSVMRKFGRICVYCGSHSGTDPAFVAGARALGALLAERGIGLVFGGGRIGLMGVIADAVLAAGGEAIGVIPYALEQKELAHPSVARMHVVQSMHERKQMMADLADGFIAMPGGIGTLEELFETWTWLQLSFHNKPVGLLNLAGFYDPLLGFLRQVCNQQFLRREHLETLQVATDPAELLEKLTYFDRPELGRWWQATDPR